MLPVKSSQGLQGRYRFRHPQDIGLGQRIRTQEVSRVSFYDKAPAALFKSLLQVSVPISMRALNGQEKRGPSILQLTRIQAQVYNGPFRFSPGYCLTAEPGRKGAESVHSMRYNLSLA